MKFHEKPQVMEGLISGGFFVFDRKFLDYLDENEGCYLEKKPLERLTKEGQFMVYSHESFWQCVDTYRELEMLNSLWKKGNAPWKMWKR